MLVITICDTHSLTFNPVGCGSFAVLAEDLFGCGLGCGFGLRDLLGVWRLHGLEDPVLGQGGFGYCGAEFAKVESHSSAVHSAIELQAGFLGFREGDL